MHAVPNFRLKVSLLVLVAGAAFYAMAVGTLGVVGIIEQSTVGIAELVMHTAPLDEGGFGGFTSVGANGAVIPGQVETVSVAIGGLSSDALLAKGVGDTLAILAQVALALCAVGLGRAILNGRPFSRAVTGQAIIAAVALLILGVASQLVSWWARVLILDEMGSIGFSRQLVIDPAPVTVGLAVALVAVVFRFGERLQRDTEGLV